MLKNSDTEITTVLPYFSSLGVDVVFLVPTETGIRKSIFDATSQIRDFLKRNHLHDYENQEQGPNYKVFVDTFLVTSNGLIDTKTSFYRPLTKLGDPRLWIYGIANFCFPNNLLALIAIGGSIYVLNLSTESTIASMADKDSGFIYKLLLHASLDDGSAAKELLQKIQKIFEQGFIRTCTSGDTGIGMTLEKALGIQPNSSTNPDYKGIELKSARIIPRGKNRSNLFSKKPNWELSKLPSAQRLLDEYGYFRNGRKQLYCTLEANRANSQGLYFFVDDMNGILHAREILDREEFREVVLWEIAELQKQLAHKHPETFWVKAKSKFENGVEYFQYTDIIHTKLPNVGLFGTLIEQKIITMDLTLSQLGTRVRDHGYLFKISPNDLGLLFPEPVFYDLNKPITISNMINI